jgi:hypothetical protein
VAQNRVIAYWIEFARQPAFLSDLANLIAVKDVHPGKQHMILRPIARIIAEPRFENVARVGEIAL